MNESMEEDVDEWRHRMLDDRVCAEVRSAITDVLNYRGSQPLAECQAKDAAKKEKGVHRGSTAHRAETLIKCVRFDAP